MAVSFLEYLFFVLEIFAFLHYVNEESDDVIGGSTIPVQHSIKNIYRNITAVFFKGDFQSVLLTLESLFMFLFCFASCKTSQNVNINYLHKVNSKFKNNCHYGWEVVEV